MRVVHYCQTFSALSQTFIYDVIVELENQGVDNTVFANKLENRADRPFSKVVGVYEPPLNGVIGLANKALSKLLCYDFLQRRQQQAQLKTLLKKIAPGVVHGHFGPQGCLALPVAVAARVPLVVSFHGYDAFRLPENNYWKKEYKKLFQRAAAVTVVSAAMKQHLASLGCPAEKIHVIHVGKRLADYPGKTQTAGPIRHFVSIGRMEEKKGHLDAIKAFSSLAALHEGLTLKIIGGGSQMHKVKQLVADMQLEKTVDIAGEMPHADVRQALYDADAFILCSKTSKRNDREGVPTVLMEAQAIKLPCVSTKHSGIPEVIPEENQWLLANEGDVSQISAVIEKLLNTPQQQLERITDLGRHKIEAEFNLVHETEKLAALYQTIAR